MTDKELEEIKTCLAEDRRLCHYFKDRYALMLLSYFVGDDISGDTRQVFFPVDVHFIQHPLKALAQFDITTNFYLTGKQDIRGVGATQL